MNEIVNKGYYTTPYQNEQTPYDKGFNNPNLNKDFHNYNDNELQNIRNKYLYLKNKLGLPTGLAADVDHIFTPEEIGNMSPDEFTQKRYYKTL